jgi:hypothetical protein
MEVNLIEVCLERPYFSFTKSSTKIAHIPTVIGN